MKACFFGFLLLAATTNAADLDALARFWAAKNGYDGAIVAPEYAEDGVTAMRYHVATGTRPIISVSVAELNALPSADVSAWQAAQDAAQANAAAMPTTFRSGVAVPIPDADGHYMLLQPQGDGKPVIAIQISDSPIDPATWKARRDAKLATIEADRASWLQAYAAKKAKAVQAAQGAQNVPQLRAAMADMQAQIDALRAIVEAGR